MKGSVKFFNDAKGYGFLLIDDSGDDLFFHVNNIRCQPADLDLGTRVEFEVGPSPKGGQEAKGLRLAEGAPCAAA